MNRDDSDSIIRGYEGVGGGSSATGGESGDARRRRIFNRRGKNIRRINAFCDWFRSPCKRVGQRRLFFVILVIVFLGLIGGYVALRITEENIEHLDTLTLNPSAAPSTRVVKMRDSILKLTDHDVLDDGDTAQHKAFMWITSDDNINLSPSGSSLIQRYVFATFYFSTLGNNWNVNTNWLSDKSECEWYGVECGMYDNNNGRKAKAAHDFFQYDVFEDTAHTTADAFFDSQVEAPTNITLSNNNVTGVIPEEFGYVISIEYLNLNNNNLVGSIPESIGNLNRLVELKLENNNLTGIIPGGIGLVLGYLGLSNNSLTGHIPESIGNLNQLVYLKLDYNDLEGHVPPEICQLKQINLENMGKDWYKSLPHVQCCCCGKSSACHDTWARVTLDIVGESDNDVVGFVVSVSGTGKRVAIGSTHEKKLSSVRVYEYSEGKGNWQQVGSMIEIREGGGNETRHPLSTSLSFDGTRLAIGVAGVNTTDNGLVRVYECMNETQGHWKKIGPDIIETEGGESFGFSVSLSQDGNRVAIGAPKHDSDNGRVYVYGNEAEGSGWMVVGDPIIGRENAGHFGWSISLEAAGNTLVAGAPKNSSVSVYEYDGVWSQKGPDMFGDESSDLFGYSVSASTNATYVAVGAPQSNGNGTRLGRATVHKFNQDGWSQHGNAIHGDTDNGNTGFSVGLSSDGSILIVGTPGNDMPGSSSSGYAKIYNKKDGKWSELGPNLVNTQPGDKPGYSVSVSSDATRFAVGVIPRDPQLGRGDVKVYSFTPKSEGAKNPSLLPTFLPPALPSTNDTRSEGTHIPSLFPSFLSAALPSPNHKQTQSPSTLLSLNATSVPIVLYAP